jgi:hypothetical protein
MKEFVLFPGRHHLLTRFQAEHLTELGGTVVWAVIARTDDQLLTPSSLL